MRGLRVSASRESDQYQSVDAAGRDSIIHVFQSLPSDSIAVYYKSCQRLAHIVARTRAYLPPHLGELCGMCE